MRREELREATRKTAQSAQHKLDRRLSKGEKRDRKRMATVAARAHLRCQAKTARVKTSSRREASAGRRAARKRTRRGSDSTHCRSGDRWQDVADQVVGPVLHAPRRAGGADVRLAGEGQQPLESAAGTANAGEAAGEDAAVEVGAQLPLDKDRQTAPVIAARAGAGQERLELVAHDLVQECLLQLAPSVAGKGGTGIARRGVPRSSGRRGKQAPRPASQEVGLMKPNRRCHVPHQLRWRSSAAGWARSRSMGDRRDGWSSAQLARPARLAIRQFVEQPRRTPGRLLYEPNLQDRRHSPRMARSTAEGSTRRR